MMGGPGQNGEKPKGDPGDGEKGSQHEVEITKPFYMGVYAVTQAEYERVMGANPSAFSAKGKQSYQVEDTDTSRFPVESVSGRMPWSSVASSRSFQMKSKLDESSVCRRRRNGNMPVEREQQHSFILEFMSSTTNKQIFSQVGGLRGPPL